MLRALVAECFLPDLAWLKDRVRSLGQGGVPLGNAIFLPRWAITAGRDARHSPESVARPMATINRPCSRPGAA